MDAVVLETPSPCNRIMLDVLQHWLRGGSNAGQQASAQDNEA